MQPPQPQDTPQHLQNEIKTISHPLQSQQQPQQIPLNTMDNDLHRNITQQQFQEAIAQQQRQQQQQNQQAQPPQQPQPNRQGSQRRNSEISSPATMTKEQRQPLMQLPKDKVIEVLNKYNAQGHMSGNMQGARPGQPPEPFNPQEAPNQFMANSQRPATGMMDPVPVPQKLLLNQSIVRGQPAEVKTWGQLKQFIMQNPQNGPPGGLDQIKNFQQAHYQNLMKNKQMQQRQQAQAAANAQNMNLGQQAPVVPPGMSTPVAPMMPGQMPNSTTPAIHAGLGQMHNIVITRRDIEKARNHPSGRYSGRSNDDLRSMIMQAQLARQRGLLQ